MRRRMQRSLAAQAQLDFEVANQILKIALDQ
jgi:hypothetical protein